MSETCKHGASLLRECDECFDEAEIALDAAKKARQRVRAEATEQTFTLTLTKDELAILTYVIADADSPYASDPLKDVYEMGKDKPEDPYAALKSGAAKFYKLNWPEPPK